MHQLFALLFSGLIMLSGCQSASDHTGTASGAPAPPVLTKPAAETTRPPAPIQDTGFTLVVSGDVLSHNANWQAALQQDGTFDYMPQFEKVRSLLAAEDYTLVNLETPVSGEKYGYRGFPSFNAPVNLAQTLKEIGVDLAVTANNHALDNGREGLRSNLDNLDKIGLEHIGTYRSQMEAQQTKVVDINGIKVGFIASTNPVQMKPVDEYSVNMNSPGKIRSDIQKARAAGAELIVYHIHWGKEYTEYPTTPQMDLYQVLAEEGVDIVIGSHPHRLQPMEMREIEYQGQKKQQAVIWSTADLLWGEPMKKDYVNTGAVFRIRAERTDGKLAVTGMAYDLVYNLAWYDSAGQRRIVIVPEKEKEQFRSKFPSQYKKMVREFEWAHRVLSRSVKLK